MRKKVSIYLIAVSLLVSPLDWIGLVYLLGPSDILFLLICFITLYDVLDRKKVRWSFVKYFYISSLFIGFGFYSVNVVEFSQHFKGMLAPSKGVLFIPLVVYWVDKKSDFDFILKTAIVVSIVVIISAYVQSVYFPNLEVWPRKEIAPSRLRAIGIPFDIRRAPGIVMGYGPFGSYALSGLFIAGSWAFTKDIRTDYKALVISIVIFLVFSALLVAQSRSTFVSSLAGIGSLVVFAKPTTRILRYAKYALVLSAFVLVVIYGIDFYNYLVSIHPKAVGDRFYRYNVALREVTNFLTGTGMSVETHHLDLRGLIHNTYLRILTRMGILSFIVYIYINFKAFSIAFAKKKNTPQFVRLSLVSCLAVNVVEMLLYDGSSNVIHYFYFALSISLYTNMKK